MFPMIATALCAQNADDSASSKPVKAGVPETGAATAANYYDKEMIVTGGVAQVTIRPTVAFLNLDKPHPKTTLSMVIFHSHGSFHGDANLLKGKSIEIHGKIRNYKGTRKSFWTKWSN